jgi:hypothetical protein
MQQKSEKVFETILNQARPHPEPPAATSMFNPIEQSTFDDMFVWVLAGLICWIVDIFSDSWS